MPVSCILESDGEQSLVSKDQFDIKHDATSDGTTAKFSIPTAKKSGQATFLVAVTYGYCRDGSGGVCKIGKAHWKVPVSLKEGGKGKSVMLKVTAK